MRQRQVQNTVLVTFLHKIFSHIAPVQSRRFTVHVLNCCCIFLVHKLTSDFQCGTYKITIITNCICSKIILTEFNEILIKVICMFGHGCLHAYVDRGLGSTPLLCDGSGEWLISTSSISTLSTPTLSIPTLSTLTK